MLREQRVFFVGFLTALRVAGGRDQIRRNSRFRARLSPAVPPLPQQNERYHDHYGYCARQDHHYVRGRGALTAVRVALLIVVAVTAAQHYPPFCARKRTKLKQQKLRLAKYVPATVANGCTEFGAAGLKSLKSTRSKKKKKTQARGIDFVFVFFFF